MKRIDYLKPNDLFYERVTAVLGSIAWNHPFGFQETENSVIIKMSHYNGAGYKLIEVDKKDVDKYFSLDFTGEETIKI